MIPPVRGIDEWVDRKSTRRKQKCGPAQARPSSIRSFSLKFLGLLTCRRICSISSKIRFMLEPDFSEARFRRLIGGFFLAFCLAFRKDAVSRKEGIQGTIVERKDTQKTYRLATTKTLAMGDAVNKWIVGACSAVRSLRLALCERRRRSRAMRAVACLDSLMSHLKHVRAAGPYTRDDMNQR